ncbi:Calx-beta domain-containing protein [Humisphaera borealis]|uniref:Calx-beta domain-containing protein n=1 Tax=Humisphaera borealis TaxID=2807512 RepID=A0A7M2X4J4_9BACT|nr:Calx-beta domain-containing protein [Humisphaera borealis]QOV91690.1 hypothetical protein IPV69_10130 [Humisphaera borealis]
MSRLQGRRSVVEHLEVRRLFATLQVNSLADNIEADDGLVTLREAVLAANSDGTTDLGETGTEADEIVFAPELTSGGPATVLLKLTGDNTFGPSALPITSAVTIVGSTGSNGITIARDTTGAPNRLRLFYVTPGSDLTLSDLTLKDGLARGGNGQDSGLGGGGGAGLGGAIVNAGQLNLFRSTLSGNQAIGGDGGSGSGFGSNGLGAGGGLAGDPSGTTGGGPNGGISTGPQAGGFGGGGSGVSFGLPAGENTGPGGFGGGGGSVQSSAFGGGGGGAGGGTTGGIGGGNGSRGGGGGGGMGGAIFNYGGTVFINNSTLSENTARGGVSRGTSFLGTPGSSLGGAVLNLNGTLDVTNSTLANNIAAEGGAIYEMAVEATLIGTQDGPVLTDTGPSVVLNNTILAGSNDGQATPTLTADFTKIEIGSIMSFDTGDKNIIQTLFPTANRNFQGAASITDPFIGILDSNGGPTRTHKLLSNSPAIDQADETLAPETDQRGVDRVGLGPDIGSYELVPSAPVLPTLSIDDVSLTEGNSGLKAFTFTVTRSFDNGDASVGWATADGTTPGAIAQAGLDYVTDSGSVQFAAGELTSTLTVNVIGDTNIEDDQSFLVNLANPVGATIADGQGEGTIQNDDIPPPTLSIADASVTEGDSGTKNISFTVTLDRKINQPVSFKYATASGTATSGTDFVAKSGTLTIPTFGKTAVITIQVKGDTGYEPNETFFVNLSAPTVAVIGDAQAKGTIVNNDAVPKIRINNAPTITEGNSGTKLMTFTVTLDRPSGTAVSVKFATADGTAKASLNDYIAKSGTVTFNPGETSKTITVSVVGDTKKGVTETLFVNLTSPVGAIIDDGQGVGTILNDD